MKPLSWRAPWWRSLGFLLLLPGLVFLNWMWRDSFTSGWWAASYVQSTTSWLMGGYFEWRVSLCEGTVVILREQPDGTAPGITFRADGAGLRREKGGFTAAGNPSWGWQSWNSWTVVERPVSPTSRKVSYRSLEIRFPFRAVIAVYAVVWMGAFLLCRGWMHRRWRESALTDSEVEA